MLLQKCVLDQIPPGRWMWAGQKSILNRIKLENGIFVHEKIPFDKKTSEKIFDLVKDISYLEDENVFQICVRGIIIDVPESAHERMAYLQI